MAKQTIRRLIISPPCRPCSLVTAILAVCRLVYSAGSCVGLGRLAFEARRPEVRRIAEECVEVESLNPHALERFNILLIPHTHVLYRKAHSLLWYIQLWGKFMR